MSLSLRTLARSSVARPLILASPISSVSNAHKFNKNVAAVSAASALCRKESTKVERPISPHVSIYAFPTPAISSITNRFTGIGMTVGVMGMSFVALGGGCDIPAYVETVKTSAPILMPLIKTVVAFPLVYHTAAGARHMFWDKTAKGLDLASVENSSKAIIAGSIMVSLGLGFYSLPALK